MPFPIASDPGERDRLLQVIYRVIATFLINNVKSELGFNAAHREVMELEGTYALREEGEAYGRNLDGESEALSLENTRFWNEYPEPTAT